MFIRRVVANLIDLFILIFSTALGIYLSSLLSNLFEELFFLLIVSLVCIIVLIPIAIQSIFWMEGTTIGKMMTFCQVVDENNKKLDYFAMFTREYLSKVLSCYLVCLPVLAGKPGIHEIVSYSHVELNYRKKGVRS